MTESDRQQLKEKAKEIRGLKGKFKGTSIDESADIFVQCCAEYMELASGYSFMYQSNLRSPGIVGQIELSSIEATLEQTGDLMDQMYLLHSAVQHMKR